MAALDVERFLRFSPAGLGLLLSVGIMGAAAANVLGGSFSERWGTRSVQAWTLVAWGALLVATAASDQKAAFVVLFVGAVSVGGVLDVVINVAATAGLGRRPGRLLRFHGLFNGGAVLGAAVTAALHGGGISWRWLWAAVGLLAIGAALLTAKAHLPAGSRGQRGSLWSSVVSLRGGLIVLAVLVGLGAVVEGGLDTWGVLYLRSQLASGVLVGSLGYVIGQSLATASRVGLGPSIGAVGARRGVSLGAGVAAGGLVLEVWSPEAALAGVGLAMAVVGIAACWPLLMAEAGGGLERPGAVVGGVTTVGYLGLLIGPLVVGGVSSALGLGAGLITLAIAAAAVSLAMAGRSNVPRGG